LDGDRKGGSASIVTQGREGGRGSQQNLKSRRIEKAKSRKV